MERERHLVRGEVNRFWRGLLRLLWGLGLAGSLVLFAVDFGLASICLLFAVVLCLGIEGYFLSVNRRQAWLIDRGDSFVYSDKAGQREFDDTQVVAVHLHHRRIYREGRLKWIVRSFFVSVDSQEAPLRFENRLDPDDADPIQPFIDRTIENYREIAKEALEAGSSLAGDGWTFSSKGLRIGNGGDLPLNEISSVGEFDDHFCVYKKGQDEAAFRIKASSKHVYLLHLLLADVLAEMPASEVKDSAGFGHLLFERRANILSRAIVWLSIPTLILLAMGLAMDKDDLTSLLGFAFGGAAILMVVYAFCSRNNVFRCHERGIVHRTWLGEKRLLFNEASDFKYQATRHYYNGVYTGTALVLDIEPLADTSSARIKFSRSVTTVDESLDDVRDLISTFIAVRWLERVKAGQPIRWTNDLTIHPHGIEHTPRGFLGRAKVKITYRFAEIAGYDIDEGFLHIWIKGRDKSVIQESTQKKNFFPGYYLFDMVYREQLTTATTG